MEWFKKHTDAIIVLSGLLTCVFWMNGRFNEVDSRFNQIEKEIAVVKTILIMKNIMPSDLAKGEEK